MVTRIEVKADLFKWAVKRSGRPIEEIERKFPRLQEWTDGDCQPSFKQLQEFAVFTYTPFGYFFLQTPPAESFPIPFYRTIDSHDSPEEVSINLSSTMQTMQFRQNWMREYLIEQGVPPLKFVQSVSLRDEVTETALRIRDTLKLSPNWASKHKTWTEALDFLQDAIETAGVLVVVNGVVGNNNYRTLDPKEFRGFVLVDEYAPLIFVNGSDGKAARMFTLAHEIAHVFLGYSAAFDLKNSLPADDLIEKKCDQIAAEFLVPACELKKLWCSAKNEKDVFQVMAKNFKVSEIVIARRALDLKYIDKTTFLKFYEDYQQKEYQSKLGKSKGGDFYAVQRFRIGKRFAEKVILATKEGNLLYSEAYRLTGLKGKTFNTFANFIGYEV